MAYFSNMHLIYSLKAEPDHVFIIKAIASDCKDNEKKLPQKHEPFQMGVNDLNTNRMEGLELTALERFNFKRHLCNFNQNNCFQRHYETF